MMSNKFVVTPKNAKKIDNEAVVMTIRLDKALQESYDVLAQASGRSRNELMCMALRYALDNVQVIENSEADCVC